MAKYKAGVYGVGDAGKQYIKAINNNPLSEVTVVVGRNKERLENRIKNLGIESEVLTDYNELVSRNDIDIVVLTGPHFLHAKESIKVARAGKHIICEKPIGMNYAEVLQVSEAVKKSGVKFQNGLVANWYAYILNLKQMVKDNILGKIFYIEADYMHNLSHWTQAWDQWQVHKRKGGPSAPLIGGIHTIDVLRRFGGVPKEVFAYQTWGNIKDYEYAPTYIAVVQFEDGVIGKTSCSYEIESPYHTNFIFHGTKGSVRNEKFYLKKTFPGQIEWQKFETIFVDSRLVTHHPFQNLVDDFINAIENNGNTVCNIDETVKTHELCYGIEKSMETKKIVEFPLSV